MSEAKKQLVIGDGDQWIKSIKDMNFPEANYQVDWWACNKEYQTGYGKKRDVE